MIGVIPKQTEVKAAHEFFQLFKTPWELFTPRHQYDVVICTSDEIPQDLDAKLVLIYNSKITEFDHAKNIAARSQLRNLWVESDSNDVQFPVYGEVLAFHPAGRACLHLKGKGGVAGFEVRESGCQMTRIGYDLFQEVSFFLSQGQPAENAHVPTLEMHISLLRNCMLRTRIPFVEVPPVPAGYDFIACLTHDVDFVGICQHKFDHTMWGFLYRALVGSLFGVLRRRMAWRKLVQNWKAALSLPFVYLGWQPDFWLEFDRYMSIEKGLRSTFFLIPYKNLPGDQVSGQAPRRRAAKYDITQIKGHVQQLAGRGCEIGLHGIDAWLSSQKGLAERGRISQVTGQSEVGVRMHWLYLAEGSPKTLEEAGFSYDSTFGYNDAVGFRAGTAQAFCPLSAENLLELPLSIQDTAMFYPSRMNLSPAEALDSCKQLIHFAATFGGALTVNWHTRSLSPERLWDEFYIQLLDEIRTYRVWFGTGAEIAQWFRNRRALCFDLVNFEENGLHLKLTGATLDSLPPLVLRTYQPKSASPVDTALSALTPPLSDTNWKVETKLEIAS